MANSYVQVPPDSTGKRLQTEQHTVNSVTVDTQVMHIGDRDVPTQRVSVDDKGAMNIRFTEGVPQLDAFGKLRTSDATILGDYIFSESTLPKQFAHTKYGTGTITHDDTLKCLVLTTGTGTSATENSNRAQITTNTYHHYFPGFSQLFMATVALSDQGEAGVMREWGYFDENNGYFFRVNGTSGLQFVIRSNVLGSVSEIVISQSSWNTDKLDGTGNSGKTLDLTDDNIYWLDVQWLGAGRVRFGTFYEGARVTAHEYYHDTNGGVPHSATGALPIRFCQHNMVGVGVANSRTLKAWCCSAVTELNVDLGAAGSPKLETFTATFDPANINDYQGLNDTGKGDRASLPIEQSYQLIGLLSPKPNIYTNPATNRTLYIPQYMQALAYHNLTGADAFVEIEVYVDPVISGNNVALPITATEASGLGTTPVFTDVEPSDRYNAVISYKNTDGRVNYFGGGYHQIAQYMKGKIERTDLGGQYGNIQDGAFKVYADNGGNNRCPILTVTQGAVTKVTINTPPTGIAWSLHREGNSIQFENIPGLIGTDATYGINDDGAGQTFYLRMVSKDTAELYLDKDFQTPWDTSGLSNATNGGSNTWPGTGGFILSGYGNFLYFAIVAKPIGPSADTRTVAVDGVDGYATTNGDITVSFVLGWNEISQ